MSDWLIYSFSGSFFFALVDVINDINLTAHEETSSKYESEEHSETNDKLKIKKNSSDIKPFGQQKEINASQDVFIASCFSVVEIFLFFFIKIELSVFDIDFSETNVQSFNYTDSNVMEPDLQTSSELNYSMIVLAGAFLFFNYYLILKAYESSSSTVIIPFMQISTIFGLVITYVQNTMGIKGSSHYDTSFTISKYVGYVIIMMGSILPATGGKLSILFDKNFWKQKFIIFIIISEASYGVYSSIISYNYSDSHGDNLECFVVSRLGFILAFCIIFIFSEKIRKTVMKLRNVSLKCYLLSFAAEICTQCALFFANYAYTINKNISIVQAAEISLTQFVNLGIAFILKKMFNLGRDESLQNFGIKAFSFVTIGLGLYISCS